MKTEIIYLIILGLILITLLTWIYLILNKKNKLQKELEKALIRIEKEKILFEKNKNETLSEKKLDHFNEKSEIEKNSILKINELLLSNEKVINELKEKFRIEKDKEYKKGVEEGIKSSLIEIQITPFKNIKSEKGFFKNTDSLEIGYSYRLFSNGIPCLDPHNVLVEKIQKSEINDQNIKIVIDKLTEIIEKIPNVKMVKNISEFGNSLKKEAKKN